MRNFLVSILLLSTFIACKTKIRTPTFSVNIEGKQFRGFSFVKVPKGSFTYGPYDEKKDIDYDYWIMQYEVSNEAYYAFLLEALKDQSFRINKDTVQWEYSGDSLRAKKFYTAKILDSRIYYANDSLYLDTNYAKHPVTEISWFGATAFCQWYNFTLPNQYEWEKAARGNTGYNYPWGDNLESNRANYHDSGDPFDNGTTPIGFYNGQNYNGYQTINSPSPYGCYDMAGNAWEYTNSTIFPDLPYVEGGGGGYLYHTGAMTQSWFRSRFGYPYPVRPDRPFISDGCRCIKK